MKNSFRERKSRLIKNRRPTLAAPDCTRSEIFRRTVSWSGLKLAMDGQVESEITMRIQATRAHRIIELVGRKGGDELLQLVMTTPTRLC